MASIINPETLAPPKGYSNGLLFEGGRILFVAGQVGWDKNERCAEGLTAQFGRALDNILDVVREAGGEASDVGRMTIYVVDKDEYIREAQDIGSEYRRRMGKHYPAMSLVEVANLLEPGARVEIEATAVLGARSDRSAV